MQRMDLSADEALRQQGWRVFRSSTRDRLIPATGQGAALRRITIARALGAAGVSEGASVSIEQQELERSSVQGARVVEPTSAYQGPGQTKFVYFNLQNVNPVIVPQPDEFIVLAQAPFSGFVTEFTFTSVVSGISFVVALRTSGGSTWSDSFSNFPIVPGANNFGPDFFDAFFIAQSALGSGREIRRNQMPIEAGDDLILVIRPAVAVGPGGILLQGYIGIEEAVNVLHLPSSMEFARRRRLRAELQAADNAAAEIRRAMAQQAIVNQDAEALGAALPLALRVASYQPVIQRRAPAPPPAPRAAPAPRVPPEGAGKTFVSAWNPSFGNIGYLIPDPPRGGKVNVFDSKYSVFDITGKLVEQGPIIPVATDQDIPPGARISPVRGGIKSASMRLDTIEAFN